MGQTVTRRAFVMAAALLLGVHRWGLPVRADDTYTVQPGDTLSGIAHRFNVSVDALMQANHLANPNQIYAGEVLVIPKRAATPTPSTPATPPGKPYTNPGRGPVLAKQRLLTYYGNPWAETMGILGEGSPESIIQKLRQEAANYAAISDKPIQPALHMVATVAQDVPGDDQKYRYRMPMDVLTEWADLAEKNNMLYILDLQPGRSTVQAEVEAMLPLLERPHIHLALDPEFNMSRTQVPGKVIGSMTATEINVAQKMLSELAENRNIPNKILIVHQFEDYMIVNKEKIDWFHQVDLAIMMDGFGGIETKLAKYKWLIHDQPVAYSGIKLFYRWDAPLMTPKQVMGIDPIPDIVVYQ